nr:serine hydrolase [uncultured Carboxylicivirga sp.]
MKRRVSMIGWKLLLVFIILGRMANASVEADSLLNDYKEKLASIFIVPVANLDYKYKYQPGYVLVNELSNSQKNHQTFSKIIIDLRSGKKDLLAYNFPSNEILSHISESGFIKKVNNSTLLYEAKNGADGIFMHNEDGKSIISVIKDSTLSIKKYEVVRFPKELKKLIPNRGFDTDREVGIGMSNWNRFSWRNLGLYYFDNQFTLNPSFEELLDKGVLFYSENIKEDHAKLVRAYENHLLLIESKIEQAYQCDTTGIKNKLNEVSLNQVKLEQTAIRLKAYRNSIALYQKRNILPLINIDQINGVVSDHRKVKIDDFIGRARFYLPNILKANDSIINPNLYISLCDSQEKLITVSEDVRRINNISGVAKILVTKGLAKPFFNSSLLSDFDAVLVADEVDEISWDLLAQALFGGISVSGINLKASHLTDFGFHNAVISKSRLAFSLPEVVGMARDTLKKVDKIISKAILEKATPGAQLLIARGGDVIWQKSYGYHTYSKKIKTKNEDLYDVASVTKLCASLPIIMDMYEKGMIKLNDSLIHYLPGIDTTDKKDIIIKDLLLHQAGLVSFIPFHRNAIDEESLNDHSLYSRHYSSTYNIKLDQWFYQNRNAKYRKDVFQNLQDSVFDIQVSKHLFMNHNYIDSMKAMVYNSKLNEKKNYLYSDVGYHFLHLIMDAKLKIPIDEYYYSHFTNRLGINRILYNPLNKFSTDVIIPTENDKSFRRELLHGYVHDQGAAMIGGVAANAGIFANSADLAIFSQMLLNKGEYGGKKYFKPETIEYFTSMQDSLNRRGLGVDKPELDPEKQSPASLLVSPSSYGHTGFTGTMVWIDPEYQLIYIFLSNRIHPDSYNKKLTELNVRTDIQDIIYKSIISN